jgi:chorismate mutase/prephenate dehydratase
MNLDDIRLQIDRIDQNLLDLLNHRADLVHEVGIVKKREGLPIYAPEREEALLQRLITMNHGRLPEIAVRAIFREIMSAALALEDNLKISYLGPEGTWTHQAAIKKFGHSVTYSPQTNFADVFDQVTRRAANYGVVPIENSTEGAVSHTLDLFVDSPLHICSQILLRIENGLMAAIPREQIKILYSHPQVFGQCRAWILKHFPDAELVEVSSTTKAAQIARDQPGQGAAALGGPLAAEMYGLTLLEKCIQDRATNTTRFLVIGEKTCPPTGHDRTSILFAIHDRPGSLVSALQAFDHFQINLSKIESRPSKRKDWEYIFYVDLAGHCDDPKVAEALEALSHHCSLVKLLGSYPDAAE